MDNLGQFFEQFRIHTSELADKIRELIHEGNVRRIIIRDDQGHTYMEIPLTVAAVGAVMAPVLAAVGAVAALVTHVNVVVERTAPPAGGPAAPHAGATGSKADTADTVPPPGDRHGAKAENPAGTGEHDSQGH